MYLNLKWQCAKGRIQLRFKGGNQHKSGKEMGQPLFRANLCGPTSQHLSQS